MSIGDLKQSLPLLRQKYEIEDRFRDFMDWYELHYADVWYTNSLT